MHKLNWIVVEVLIVIVLLSCLLCFYCSFFLWNLFMKSIPKSTAEINVQLLCIFQHGLKSIIIGNWEIIICRKRCLLILTVQNPNGKKKHVWQRNVGKFHALIYIKHFSENWYEKRSKIKKLYFRQNCLNNNNLNIIWTPNLVGWREITHETH